MMTEERQSHEEREELAPAAVPAPLNGYDLNREAVLRAANAYDDLRGQIREHEERIAEATEALEHRNARIQQLELALAEERARCVTLQTERDNAVIERAELHVMFASFKAQLDSFVAPLPPLPSRRRRRPAEEAVAATE